MPIWPSDAFTAKFGFCISQKQAERRKFRWFFAHRTEIVGLSLHRLDVTQSPGTLRSIAAISNRSKLGREDIKWQELLLHFRSIQAKHEKARRQALGTDTAGFSGIPDSEQSSETANGSNRTATGPRPPMRRKVTGDPTMNTAASSVRPGALSPLNPRARIVPSTPGIAPPTSTAPSAALGQVQKQRGALGLSRR